MPPVAQAIAALAQPAPPQQQPQGKEKKLRISKQIMRACELITTGECKTIKAAAERVGCSREWLSRCLQRDHVRVFIERQSRQTIAAGTMRASARLIDLLDAGSEHVSLDASKHVLGIAGIKPAEQAQVSVNIDIRAGYVIDLSEPEPQVIDAKANADD